MKFPDFIIVGVAKCGTTPLWFNLDKHPDITMAPRSATRGKTEMYFWGTSNYKNKGIDWYKKKFKGKVSGEKTPTYSGKKIAFLQMKKHIPDVKLILCVRHPAERAFSNYRMNRKSGKVGAEFTYNIFLRRYSADGKYIRPLKKMLSVFDKDQIHVCVTERMKKNTVEEMNKIYSFLGLENVDIERRVVELQPMTSAGENMKIRRQETWYRVWDQYKKTVKGKLRKQIVKYYEKYNNAFFEVLGYEIDEWKK